MPLCPLQFVVVVGFLLVMVLAFTYPQNTPPLGLVSLGSYNWSSPLSHVRLLSLPIAKKYNLQGLKHVHALGFSPLQAETPVHKYLDTDLSSFFVQRCN